MPYYGTVMPIAKFVLAAFISVAAVMAFTNESVAAQDTGSRVEVMVCPDPSGSSIAVAQPASDSIVSEPKVMVSGSVVYISQIDFFIDNVYNNTLALGSADKSFTSQVTLSPGTHTLRIVATDSCSQTTHTENIVVTYEPTILPSAGRDVETTVGGQLTTPIDNADNAIPSPGPIEEFFNSTIMPPVAAIGRALDIIPFNNEASLGGNAARSSVFVLGSALVLSALYISMLGALPAKLAFLGSPHSKIVWGMAATGLVAMTLVFML